MIENLFDDCGFFDSCDDSNVAVTLWAVADVDVKDSLKKPCPRDILGFFFLLFTVRGIDSGVINLLFQLRCLWRLNPYKLSGAPPMEIQV